MFDLKKILTLFTLLLIFSSSGCSATKTKTNEKVKVETPSNANISLLDQLRRSPGLIIRGSGQNAVEDNGGSGHYAPALTPLLPRVASKRCTSSALGV